MKNIENLWKTAIVFYRKYFTAIVAPIGAVVILFLLIYFGFLKIPDLSGKSELEKLRAQQQKIADIIKTGDISQCEKIRGTIINNTDYYSVCKNNILLNSSQNSLDISQCDQVDPSFMPVDLCKRNVVTKSIMSGSDVAVCDGLEPGLARYCKNIYWIKTAIKYDDAVQCNNLSEMGDVVSCKDNLAMERLIFGSGAGSCDVFSLQYRKGCNEFRQIRSKVPQGVQADCSAVTEAVFHSLCEDRKSMDNI